MHIVPSKTGTAVKPGLEELIAQCVSNFEKTVVFVDCSIHYHDYVKAGDETKRKRLKAKRYRIVSIEAGNNRVFKCLLQYWAWVKKNKINRERKPISFV